MNNLYRISGFILSFWALSMLISCNKESAEDKPVPITSLDELVIADNFNYEMSGGCNIKIFTQDATGHAMPGVRVEIYSDYNEETEDGNLIITGITNNQGILEMDYPVSFITNKLYLVTHYIGLPTVTEAQITNNTILATIGGIPQLNSFKSNFEIKSIDANYNYLCAFNSSGVPQCLVNPRDNISASMLADINAALPERSPVPVYHPEYLANLNQTDIKLLETADVWLTCVHEGAAFRSAVAFYTYDVNNPPTNKNQISQITIAFPNFSLLNSGGGLVSGDKVYLGQFPANTGIGWVLIANGYTGSGVNTGAAHYYSNPSFNPETTAEKRQHNVLLFDAERQIYLIGFEDVNRTAGGDNDFNDAVFYVTSNPVEAIDNSNMPFVDPNLIDSDGDGVFDVMDDYPNDASRAFNNYYPGRTQFGSFAFEDLWPEKGDYDFNDLVISYQINQITNANNKVVDIVSTNTIEAIGAGFKNGFGFQLNIPPSAVANVSGFNHTENIISLSSNNTESGQNKATIIPFDNTYNLFDNISQGYVNTKEDMEYITPKSITVTINLSTPQTMQAIGLPPFNPFLIVNKTRGREVHLPGYAPTSLADASYFGTFDDDTNLSTGKYYKSKTNLPWAMNLPEDFAYPLEKRNIITAHNVFGNWVQSGGYSYMDWYVNNPGYRTTQNIYQAGK
ncbi:MAG: LruC domain-containing protein [Lentimicrobiaceae bacterium]|nr:LruC domain-containing protein [Lentimicrobiaceae bacterium]